MALGLSNAQSRGREGGMGGEREERDGQADRKRVRENE